MLRQHKLVQGIVDKVIGELDITGLRGHQVRLGVPNIRMNENDMLVTILFAGDATDEAAYEYSPIEGVLLDITFYHQDYEVLFEVVDKVTAKLIANPHIDHGRLERTLEDVEPGQVGPNKTYIFTQQVRVYSQAKPSS